jgi:hypothetical protein
MGISPLFCCFNNQQPKCLAGTGIVASFLAFVFLIWGVADLEFKRTGVQAIYIIAFIFVILILLAYIALLIFLIMKKSGSYKKIMNLGRIICLAILVLTCIAFIFLLIAWIILLVDYSKLHSYLKDLRNDEVDEDEDLEQYEWGIYVSGILTDLKIAGHEWGAVVVPGIIGLIALILNGLIANYLYKVFMDNYNSAPEFPVNNIGNQNTVGVTVPNVNQPGLFPNNNGPFPPMGNNFNNNVQIQQN